MTRLTRQKKSRLTIPEMRQRLREAERRESEKRKSIVHVEFPMFGKKMLCGLLYREVKAYAWAIDTPNGWNSVTCKECKRIARERKLAP